MKVTAPLRKSNSLVYIRIHDGRDIDFKVSAGIYIDPTHFDPKVPGYKRTSAVPAEVRSKTNKDIKAMIALVEENYRTGCDAEWLRQLLDDYRNGRPVATSPLESEALPQEPRDLPFWDIAELYIEKKKDKSAITSIFRRMRRYEAWQEKMAGRKGFRLSVPDFGLTELENFLDYTSNEYLYYLKCPDFFKDFEIYHSTMRPSSKNSLYSTCSRLKAFLNWCVKRGYTEDTSFREALSHNQVYGIPYYLTIEERDRLLDFDLTAWPSARQARDMFVFQCLVGCRLGDLFRLTRSNIMGDFIEYIPSKDAEADRAEVVRVPLAKKAKEILARYEGYAPRLFPSITRQDYNAYIRFAMQVAGIRRVVTILNPLTREEEQHPLYEVASSHMARRTFVGNIYKHVKDQALVSSLTGHLPTSHSFERYRTIDDDMKREVLEVVG